MLFTTLEEGWIFSGLPLLYGWLTAEWLIIRYAMRKHSAVLETGDYVSHKPNVATTQMVTGTR